MAETSATQGGGLTLQQAIEEAHRCLLCHDAPCSKGCPGGTDPGKFIRQIRFYNLKGAARTVLRNNPLGGACAYVCPTDDTCVRACLRAGLDRPIDIDGLQAFAVEYGRQHGVQAMTAGERRPEKVAVVGAGPAGLTAAARLAQWGYAVTVYEAREQAGGMLRYGVPGSRLATAVLDADLQEILALGVELRLGHTIEAENGAAALLDEGFAAVFVAPGLWRPMALEIPGIDLEGVGTAIAFLEQARTDEASARTLVANRNLAIIGGGSVAMDVALVARQLGARRIHAIALEGMNELPAQPDELAHAMRDGIVIKPQSRIQKVVGDGGQVVAVEGVETEWIEPGKLVPANARDVEGSAFRLPVGAVIQAIGQSVSNSAGRILARANKVGARVQADRESQATSLEGVFAGGDIVRGPSTVVAAVGDGKRAARAIHQQLSGQKEVGA